jgi:ring-1,2-phenylacetyl-CoA epoxidase subunit PaaD
MRPSLDTVREWLAEIPDPEIPAVSLVDLGIVRGVAYEGEELVVTVTPTYSGCPATSMIALDIETALLKHGAEHIAVRQKLSPPWTTDWISADGRRKLADYGIAPPSGTAATCAGLMSRQSASCPRCGSNDTEMLAARGSTPCKAQFRCRECLEPFDYFKVI